MVYVELVEQPLLVAGLSLNVMQRCDPVLLETAQAENIRQRLNGIEDRDFSHDVILIHCLLRARDFSAGREWSASRPSGPALASAGICDHSV